MFLGRKERIMSRCRKNYIPYLIEQVKAAGQEIIDRAEDLVGSGELMTSFDIWLRFSQDDAPTIEVSREYFSKKGLSVYLGATWEEEREERKES